MRRRPSTSSVQDHREAESHRRYGGRPPGGGPSAKARPRNQLQNAVPGFSGAAFPIVAAWLIPLPGQIGRNVDLVTPDALKPRMRPTVDREAVDVA